MATVYLWQCSNSKQSITRDTPLEAVRAMIEAHGRRGMFRLCQVRPHESIPGLCMFDQSCWGASKIAGRDLEAVARDCMRGDYA